MPDSFARAGDAGANASAGIAIEVAMVDKDRIKARLPERMFDRMVVTEKSPEACWTTDAGDCSMID